MIKKLLLLASSVVTIAASTATLQAQVKYDIFNIPDTVCTEHAIEPYDIIEGAQTYNWSFCPPNLAAYPTGGNLGPFSYFSNPVEFKFIRDNNNLVAFFLNKDGYIYKMRYTDGITQAPTQIRELGKVANVGKGLYPINSGNEWHVFVIGGDAWNNTNLMRMDFGNGTLQNPTHTENYGTFDSLLTGSNRIVVAKDVDNNWYGFTVNNRNNLLRLDFGTNIKSRPYITNLGAMYDQLADVTSFELIKELDNWHLFITNKTESAVKRVSFGNSFRNPAYIINYGTLNNTVARPVGISITRDCDRYYGWVLSEGNSNLVGLVWDNSIADTPTASNLGNFVGIRNALCLSNTVRENGGLYMMSTNAFDQSMSLIEYKPCEAATPAYKDQRLPPTFQYSEPGYYNVTLTVDEGLPTVKTECQTIYVYAHRAIQVNTNDTIICSNDTIRAQVLIFDIDSIVWSPNYNIDTTLGNTVHLWPHQNSSYYYTTYFNRDCIVKKKLDVNVSKIYADAGPDRMVTDGASTALGGPNTTIVDDYDYQWTPNIGLTGSEWTPFTTTKPPYNITYYLEVSNDLGCKALDSVNIVVPCEKVSLPNAFNPGSTNGTVSTFKIMNNQFSKINSFKVYDRWGKVMFETTDPTVGWDGMVDGNPAQFGVYVWEVDATCANTLERIKSTGNVTLIR